MPIVVVLVVSSIAPFHWLAPSAQAQEGRLTRVAAPVGKKPKIVVEYDPHPEAVSVDGYFRGVVEDFIQTLGERIPLWALGELAPGTIFYVRLVRLDSPEYGPIALRATLVEFSGVSGSGLRTDGSLRVDIPYFEFGVNTTAQLLSERLQGQLLRQWLILRDVKPENKFWSFALWMRRYAEQLQHILEHKEPTGLSSIVGPSPAFVKTMIGRFLRLVEQLEAEAHQEVPSVAARALAVIRGDPYVRERWMVDHWFTVFGKFLDLVAQINGHAERWSHGVVSSDSHLIGLLSALTGLHYPPNYFDNELSLKSALEGLGWYGFVRNWFRVPAEGLSVNGNVERRMSAYAMLVPDLDRRYPVGDFSLLANETLFEQNRPIPQTLTPTVGSPRISRERLIGLNGYVSDAFRNILRRLAGSAFDGALSLVSVEWLFMGDGSLMSARVRVRLELGEWTSGVHPAGAYRAPPIESGPRSGVYDLWVSNLADPTLHNLPWPDLLHSLEVQEQLTRALNRLGVGPSVCDAALMTATIRPRD